MLYRATRKDFLWVSRVEGRGVVLIMFITRFGYRIMISFNKYFRTDQLRYHYIFLWGRRVMCSHIVGAILWYTDFAFPWISLILPHTKHLDPGHAGMDFRYDRSQLLRISQAGSSWIPLLSPSRDAPSLLWKLWRLPLHQWRETMPLWHQRDSSNFCSGRMDWTAQKDGCNQSLRKFITFFFLCVVLQCLGVSSCLLPYLLLNILPPEDNGVQSIQHDGCHSKGHMHCPKSSGTPAWTVGGSCLWIKVQYEQPWRWPVPHRIYHEDVRFRRGLAGRWRPNDSLGSVRGLQHYQRSRCLLGVSKTMNAQDLPRLILDAHSSSFHPSYLFLRIGIRIWRQRGR